MRVSKDVIVRTVAKETGYNITTVNAIVKCLLDNIMFEVGHGREVHFSGFGLFEPKTRGKRIGRNPHTKEAVPIPARIIPSFKPGEKFKAVATRVIK